MKMWGYAQIGNKTDLYDFNALNTPPWPEMVIK